MYRTKTERFAINIFLITALTFITLFTIGYVYLVLKPYINEYNNIPLPPNKTKCKATYIGTPYECTFIQGFNDPTYCEPYVCSYGIPYCIGVDKKAPVYNPGTSCGNDNCECCYSIDKLISCDVSIGMCYTLQDNNTYAFHEPTNTPVKVPAPRYRIIKPYMPYYDDIHVNSIGNYTVEFDCYLNNDYTQEITLDQWKYGWANHNQQCEDKKFRYQSSIWIFTVMMILILLISSIILCCIRCWINNKIKKEESNKTDIKLSFSSNSQSNSDLSYDIEY